MTEHRLNTFVHVPGPDGNVHVFGPHSTLPEWAAEAISNPNVWADDVESGDSDDDAVEAVSGPPAKSGRGSGKPAWLQYATDNHVAVAADATREEIIETLDAAGIATE